MTLSHGLYKYAQLSYRACHMPAYRLNVHDVPLKLIEMVRLLLFRLANVMNKIYTYSEFFFNFIRFKA